MNDIQLCASRSAGKGAGRFIRVLKQATALIAVLGVCLSLFPTKAEAGFFSQIVKFFTNADVGERRALIEETKAAGTDAPALAALSNPEQEAKDETPDIATVQESALVAPANPLGTIQTSDAQDRIFVYTVKPGDSAASIAKSFKVSVNTILWGNGLRSASSIHAGDQLLILPVSGVSYTVKKGDTIATIAKKFSAEADEISAFNGLALGSPLTVGAELIIPNGELQTEQPATGVVAQRFASLPVIKGYFQRPIQGGRKSQGIHGNNGVDLANSCGLPVFASADGTVLIARETGYNGGFGKFIVINHPNGTQTVYAHNQKNMVAVGEEVKQGQIIGLIGNTGNTRGATGCHVHFEIHGARNPF